MLTRYVYITQSIIKQCNFVLTYSQFCFRLRCKRDFRIILRCFSEKPTDDGKLPETQPKHQEEKNKISTNATEKIQELLKSMMAEPKISEAEYRERFATAPDIPKRQKQEDEISVKMEKMGKFIQFHKYKIMLVTGNKLGK